MMSFRLFATAAVAALCLAATPALAQTTPKQPATAAKKKQPPAAATPAAAPAAASDATPKLEGAVGPTLSGAQPDWVKACQTDPQSKKELCATTRALRSDTGQTVMLANLMQVTQDKKQILRLILPVGLMIQPGVGIYLDNALLTPGKFLVCTPDACIVELDVDDAALAAMRKAKTLAIAVKQPPGEADQTNDRTASYTLSMDGFNKVLDGKPLDPQSFVNQQKKLQEQLQQAADKARKDLGTTPDASAPAQ